MKQYLLNQGLNKHKEKMNKKFSLFLICFLLSITFLGVASAALNVSLSDQGTDVKDKSTGNVLTSGNLEVSVYDNLTGGNLIYDEIFAGAIVNGSWNVMLGENSSNPLQLEFGKIYYKDYKINGLDLDFTDFQGNTVERQFFYSPLGDISGEDINQSANLIIASLNVSEGNITNVNYGFFSYLGSLLDRITELFVQDITFNGSINGSGNVEVGGNLTVNDRVGIGTSSPAYKLDVNGSINLPNTDTIKFGGDDFIRRWETNQSIAVGKNAGAEVLYSSYFGDYAGYLNTGSHVTATGYDAGRSNTGSYVTATGMYAGLSNTGNYLTAIGYDAGNSNIGNFSSGYGYEALKNNSGNNVVAIGYQAGKNNIIADQFIVKQTNINSVPLIQGNFSSGNVGIGTESPGYRLTVKSSATNANVAVIEASDGSMLYRLLEDADGNAMMSLYNASANEKVRLDPAGNSYFRGGNVGIGTTTPTELLDIGITANNNDGIVITSGGTEQMVMIGSVAGAGHYLSGTVTGDAVLRALNKNLIMGTHGNYNLSLNTNNLQRLTILGSGKVGIGTTSPSVLLELRDGGTDYAPTAIDTVLQLGSESPAQTITGKGFGFKMSFDYDLVGKAAGIAAIADADYANDVDLAFYTSPDSGTYSERMRIDNTGNVGIGTSSPSQKLNVMDSTTNRFINFTGPSATWAEANIISGSVIAQMQANTGGSAVQFGSRSEHNLRLTTNDIIRVVVDTTGNVGIGTTSPQKGLSIGHLGGSDSVMSFIAEDTSYNWSIGIDNSDAGKFKVANTDVGNSLDTNAVFTIDRTGNVGIGTTSPHGFLHINGEENRIR